jgi:hypothetical protein
MLRETEHERTTVMNATRQDPQSRPKTTQTIFPAPRPAVTASPASARPAPFEARKDDDHPPEEPGYGHGV